MNDLSQRCEKLLGLLHKEVPLSETIGVGVHDYDGETLELRADLGPNINVHGIAFGGSIYSICALAAWGLLMLRFEDHGLDPRIMIAAAEIEYRKPVRQAIRASAAFTSAGDFDGFVDALGQEGKSRLKIPVSVKLDDGEIAAEFLGDYIAFMTKA